VKASQIRDFMIELQEALQQNGFFFFYLQMPIHQNYNVLWKEFKTDKKAGEVLPGISLVSLASVSASCGLPFKGAESAGRWQCWLPGRHLLGWYRLVPVIPLASGRDEERAGEEWASWPAWLGEAGCHLHMNLSLEKEVQLCRAEFWPMILFFLSRLHSLTQNIFNAAFFVENWGLG